MAFRLTTLAVILMLSSTAVAQNQSELTPQEILRRAEQTTRDGFEHAPEFDYCVTSADGDHTKTFAAYMMFGSTYEQLIEVNGIPLPKDQLAALRSAYDAETNRRRNETTEQRDKRMDRYQSEQRRNRTLLKEMTKAFTFSYLGKGTKDGWKTYILDVAPRPGYAPKDRYTRVLTGMRGTLWIDEQSFGWVRAEATVVHPVMVQGILARVEKGTRFAMEERPFGNGYWLPTFFSIHTRARILLIFPSSSTEFYRFFHYVPAGTLTPDMCLTSIAPTAAATSGADQPKH